MGSGFSDLKYFESNINVIKFFGQEEINSSDPFWNQLLSFAYIPNYSLNESDLISYQLKPIIKLLNKSTSRNTINFITVFLIRSEELKRSSDCSSILSKDSIFLNQIYNGLFILRNVFKSFTENNMINVFFDGEIGNENRCVMKKLLNALVSMYIEITISSATYFVHLEIILILNIVMNSDMYTDKASLLQDLLFENESSMHSRIFIKSLLENIIEHHSKKLMVILDQGILSNKENLYTGSSLWNIISFGYFSQPNTQIQDSGIDRLSSESVFFILKICLYSKTKDCYKQSLFSLFDPSLMDLKSFPNENYLPDSTLEISFSKILNLISSNFEEEHFVLLFYLLIHKNINFRTYILSRETFKDIILPLIKLIYNYNTENSNLVYMALIILLIMTENSYFNSSIHREIIEYVHWIKEKTITNMSIGSLIVWILCRAIQYNFGYIGDRYIHINCLASLANMSSKFVNLHPQASEQIMVLLNILQKRKTFILHSLNNIEENQENDRFSNLTNNLSVIEEILQMFVEIINTALIFSLNNNPHMIHTFLYHRKIFPMLKDNSNTQSHACNIDAILTYFSSKIEKELGKSVSSQHEVLKIIKKFSPSINKLNNFKRFPELKFKYIEQESSDEFFIPYIWRLLCRKSLVYFKKHDDFSNNCKC